MPSVARKDDRPVDPELAGPLQARGVEQLVRDRAGELPDEEDPDDSRQGGQSGTQIRVHESHRAQHQEERQHRDRRRDDERRQKESEDAVAAGEAELRERIAGHRVQEQDSERRDDGDQEAVGRRAAERQAREELHVVAERRARGEKRRRETARFAGPHERGGGHPDERRQREHSADDERRVHEQCPAPPSHASPRFWIQNCTAVRARTTMKRTNAIEAAYPMLHQRNPFLYMRRPTESVAFKGLPPSVMT